VSDGNLITRYGIISQKTQHRCRNPKPRTVLIAVIPAAVAGSQSNSIICSPYVLKTTMQELQGHRRNASHAHVLRTSVLTRVLSLVKSSPPSSTEFVNGLGVLVFPCIPHRTRENNGKTQREYRISSGSFYYDYIRILRTRGRVVVIASNKVTG